MQRYPLGFLAAAVLSGPAFCSGAFAQVTSFPSSATVSYNLGGSVSQSGDPGKVLGDDKQLSTNNPLTNPVQLNGNINGSAGGGALASSSAITAAGAGLLRVGIEGMASAAWQAEEFSDARLNSSARVSWTDYVLVTGDPAHPEPFRPLIVQALLNIGGNMSVNPTVAPSFPSFSIASAGVTLKLTGRDGLNRDLLAPPPSNYSFHYGQAVGGSGNFSGSTYNLAPVPIVAVTLMLLEGQPSFMSYSMDVAADAIAKTNHPYFAGGSTSVSFIGDFTHTLSWGGITSVTDANTGAPVPGWSVESASGTNYAIAVPEPASVSLLAVACAGLARRRRRR